MQVRIYNNDCLFISWMTSEMVVQIDSININYINKYNIIELILIILRNTIYCGININYIN